MRISDWSSDVCSSDLVATFSSPSLRSHPCDQMTIGSFIVRRSSSFTPSSCGATLTSLPSFSGLSSWVKPRSEEHTSELQSLMRNSYAGVCLKKKTRHIAKNQAKSYYTPHNKRTRNTTYTQL